jgi:hypothetical protein
VDSEDAAADADEEEYRKVIYRPEGARAEDGRTSKRLFLYVIFILFISKYMPRLCNTVQEFPFSINRPPPTEIRDEQLLTVPYSSLPWRAS